MTTAVPRREPAAPGPRPALDRLDRLGLVLLGAAIAWTLLSAVRAGGNPWPMTASLVGAAMGVAVGRIVGARLPLLVPAVVLGLPVVLLLGDPEAILAGSARGGPLGYPNAVGALFVQGAAAALIMSALARGTTLRVTGFVGAAGCVLVPATAGSIGAAGTATVLAAAWVVALGKRWIRLATLGCALVAATALAGTVGIAAGGADARNRSSTIVRALGERPVLWADALEIAGEHALVGVGPGRFAEVSPTARADRDLRWAHHEYLQQAVETGLPGAALLVASFAWGFGRLWLRPSAAALLAAAGLAALAVQASIDYVLHFPVILVVAGALVGSASRAGGPAEAAGYPPARAGARLGAAPGPRRPSRTGP
jgi:hypothetical protein